MEENLFTSSKNVLLNPDRLEQLLIFSFCGRKKKMLFLEHKSPKNINFDGETFQMQNTE